MALASNALTTVATLCDELGITVPADGSAGLRSLERRINVASSAIASFCQREFGQEERTEKVAGYGSAVLQLRHYPVSGVSAVSYGGFVLDAESYECTGEDARVGHVRNLCGEWEDTAHWQSGGAPDRFAGSEQPDYSVTYVAGYVLPKDAADDTPATLPHELEEACLLTAVASYLGKGRDPNILSESLLGGSVTYVGSTVNTGIGRGLGGIIPDNAVMLLAPFVRKF